MVEKTAKGKEARQYFIACEKSLKQGNSLVLNDDLRNVIYTVVTQALEDLSKPPQSQQKAADLPEPVIDESIDAWFNACVILDPNARTKIGSAYKNSDGSYRNTDKWLYPNYREFCEKENLEPISMRRFSGLLIAYCRQKDLKVKRLRRNQEGMKIKGIAIL
jgi:putative DNA primase/helicase